MPFFKNGKKLANWWNFTLKNCLHNKVWIESKDLVSLISLYVRKNCTKVNYKNLEVRHLVGDKHPGPICGQQVLGWSS